MPEENDHEINLWARLLKITDAAKKIPKLGKNTFANYDYVRAVDLIAHVKELMVLWGVHQTLSVVDSRRIMHGKNFHSEIDCIATFINVDKPEERHEVLCRGVAADTLDKDISKALTAVTKYLFTTEFKIVTSDVVDIESQKKEHGENDNLPRVTDEQIINLRALCESLGFPIDETLASLAKKVYRIKKIEDLQETFYEDAVGKLNAKATQ